MDQEIATIENARRHRIGVGQAQDQPFVGEVALPLNGAAQVLAMAGIGLAGLGQNRRALAVPNQQVFRARYLLAGARHQLHTNRPGILMLPRNRIRGELQDRSPRTTRTERKHQKRNCTAAKNFVEHDSSEYTRVATLANDGRGVRGEGVGNWEWGMRSRGAEALPLTPRSSLPLSHSLVLPTINTMAFECRCIPGCSAPPP